MKYSPDAYLLHESNQFITFNIRIKVVMKENVEPDTLTVAAQKAFKRFPYYSKQIHIDEIVIVNGITVEEAIAASDGEEVQVKGIVGGSLVNRDGFYLIDETGIIAIICTSDILAELEVGYEIVIKGTRGHNKKPETTFAIGQSYIGNTKLLAEAIAEAANAQEGYYDKKDFQ